ncbi:unnamed protein product [Paramecium primaurelia]|uniref:Uncharacterized protein n=1 Tax=Paramecium primaurelia TaxID=5886 RepID=A0A8S1KSK7_PARPR|nr:unnamed protein product [Paramecium primaurelia]
MYQLFTSKIRIKQSQTRQKLSLIYELELHLSQTEKLEGVCDSVLSIIINLSYADLPILLTVLAQSVYYIVYVNPPTVYQKFPLKLSPKTNVNFNLNDLVNTALFHTNGPPNTLFPIQQLKQTSIFVLKK